MRIVWVVHGTHGTPMFSSRTAAERVVQATPSDWGRAVGGRRPTIEEVRVFDSAEEWAAYTGTTDWFRR